MALEEPVLEGVAATDRGQTDRAQQIAPPSRTPVPADEIDRLFPDLEVKEILGSGGMGAVYRAEQLRLGRTVALKILSCPEESGSDFALRFEQEARVLAKLHHPGIVTVFDFGEVKREPSGESLLYFLMEYVEGRDLSIALADGPVDPPVAFRIVSEVCDALQFAHDRGVIHRDIKPANLIFSGDGSIKVADFGIAKLNSSNEPGSGEGAITRAGHAVGTPFYTAPELWVDPTVVSPSSDIYSLGVVLHEMLTGESPSGCYEAPSKTTSIPTWVDRTVFTAISAAGVRRYPSARAFKEAAEKARRRLSAPWRRTVVVGVGIALLCLSLSIVALRKSIFREVEPAEATAKAPVPASIPKVWEPANIYIHCLGKRDLGRLQKVATILSETGHRIIEVKDFSDAGLFPVRTELRYFRDPDDKGVAEKLLDLVRTSGKVTDARLLYVGGYEHLERETQIELWVAPTEFDGRLSTGETMRKKSPALKPGALHFVPKSSRPAQTNDLFESNSLQDIVSVHFSEGDWYALRNNGRMISSRGGFQKSYVESVSSGASGPLAVIETGGNIEFLSPGLSTSGLVPVPAPEKGDPPVVCETGNGHGVILTDRGRVKVWGSVYQSAHQTKGGMASPWPRPDNLTEEYVAVAACRSHAAALGRDGKIVIWGADGNMDTSSWSELGPFSEIQGMAEVLYLLAESGVVYRYDFSTGTTGLPSEVGNGLALGVGVILQKQHSWLPMPESSGLAPTLSGCAPANPAQIAIDDRNPGSGGSKPKIIWIEPKQ